MAEKYEEISDLVIAYITKQLTEEQERSLKAWLEESSANKAWLEQWDDMQWIAKEVEEYNKPDVDESLSQFWAVIDQEPSGTQLAPAPTPTRRPVWKYIISAAALVLLIAGAWMVTKLYLSKSSTTITITDTNRGQIDSAGGEQITLSSAGKPLLVIDSLPNGFISSQAGVNVVKLDSILLYHRISQDAAALNIIQSISTGKGKRLQVILPDSSSVWLNAASSIRFPLAYHTERWIEVTGEVYVEVHKDKLHPFWAIAGNMKVIALGTKFNINAYNATKKVALLEGKIAIQNGNADTTLSVPGETASLDTDFKIKISRTRDIEDIEKVTAWRTGAFNFRKDHITDALREIERWYGVEVRYINTPPTVISHSSFPRNLPLPAAIRLINQVDSNLTIFKQDNVLIVSYKK